MALLIPSATLPIISPTFWNAVPTIPNTLSKFRLDKYPKNSSITLVVLLNISPIFVNSPFIPLDTFSNIPLLLAASFMLLTNLPTPFVADITTSAILPNNPVRGNKLFASVTTIFLPKSIIENKPLKVFLILVAVLSLILNLSVSSLNPLEISASFSPVIAGNTSLHASPIAPKPLPMLFTIVPKPEIMSSLPPISFQVLSISFLALTDGSIISLNPSLIAVKNLAAWSLSPMIYSQD